MSNIKAILGADAHGMAEALFMRSFTDRLTLLTLTHPQLSASERQRLRDASVHIVDTPISAMAFPPGEGDGLVRVTLADGGTLSLDTLYCALGSETRNALAVPLGVKLAEGQCFLTDAHQRCNVPGLYAAGDAVAGLDQISVATGTGARAAVAIHNDLRDRDGEGSAA